MTLPDSEAQVGPRHRVRCHGCDALHPAAYIVLARGLGRTRRSFCASCAEVVLEQERRPGVALVVFNPPTAIDLQQGEGGSWLVLVCPLCGERHSHGAGGPDDDPAALLGYRVAGCANAAGGGYELVRADVDPLPSTNRAGAIASRGGA